jgi:hypothetical protein
MQEDKKKEINEYFQTFFGAIRTFLEKEQEYQNGVPEIFRFPYMFLVFDCTDGYIVALYPSGIADNYLYIEQNKPLLTVLKTLPNKILGAENHITIGLDDWNQKGRYELVVDRVETNRGPYPTTGWKFLYVSSKDEPWSKLEARKQADEYVSIFRARAAIYEPTCQGFIQNYTPVVLRQEVVTRLHSILDGYRTIISDRNYRERVIHQFIHNHPILLFPTKKRLLYEYPLFEEGKVQYKIDFVVEVTSGKYILVELENPNHRIFTRNGDFTQAVNHAERQVSDWFVWIRRNLHLIGED